MMLLALLPTALAWESEAQHVKLEDEAGIFESVEFSTGTLPEDSPVGVEFRLESNGGASVIMEGEASLTWPENVTFGAEGEAGSGIFVLECSLDAITTVNVDLSEYGGPSGSFEIDHRTINLDGATFFDPFVLEGAATDHVEIVDTTDSTQLIQYSYEIFAGVSLDFQADMTPTITVGFEGVQWQANEGMITAENTPIQLTPLQAADFIVDSTFRGAWNGTISLVFTPSISITAPFLGTIPLVEFEYPLDIVSADFEQDFAPTSYTFPMPLLEPGSDSQDFGEIEIETIATVEIPVQNLGNLSLYGSAVIEGSSAFTVYPDQFNALPGTSDGLTVTYAPTEVADDAAELVLTSNDPAWPDVRVALVGSGVQSDIPGESDDTVTVATSSCGCSTPTAAAPSAMFSLAVALLAWRRRA